MPRSLAANRKKIQNFSTAVRLNGTSSFFAKATPTGINTGTDSRTLLARIYLTGATDNALGCLCQFKRSLVNQSPGFLIGVLGGLYYVGFDTINPANNLTITEAEFKRHFRMRRWLDVAYVMTTTTLLIYVNRVLVATKTWGVPINTLALSQLYFGKATVMADTDAYFLAALIKEALIVNGACTIKEISDWSLKGVRPANVVSGFGINEGTGQDTADDVGTNNLTGSNITWVSNVPTKARTTASGRQTADIYGAAGAYASGTITVNDYSELAGVMATGSFTVTDYTHLVGASLDLFGFATLVEGADFNAATSNDATALSIANAINTAVGEDVTDVSGATVKLIVPGNMNGQSATWTVPLGGGVTPTVVTMTGGVAVTDLHLAGGFQPFGTGPGLIDPGSDNDECADNIAAWINGGGGLTAVAVGNVVTVTANDPGVIGNTYDMSQEPHGGVGTISNGLSFSGATLTGGVDATTSRHRSLAT